METATNQKTIEIECIVLTEESINFIRRMQDRNNSGVISESEDMDMWSRAVRKFRHEEASDGELLNLLDLFDRFKEIFHTFSKPLPEQPCKPTK